MNNTASLRAETSCFWKLLKEKDITMPLYQRDYVQGRDDDAAKLIRTEFVADLVDAVIGNGQNVALHFVFGGRDNNKDGDNVFVPVDGQQRLTALFLLHWYVLFEGGATEEQKKRLGRFHYKSRETSNRFCGHLAGLLYHSVDAAYDHISDLIKDCPWFTGNISYDPTVASMLVVLDEIQHQFQKVQLPNWENWKNRLLTEDATSCPITFLQLDMENALGHGSEIRDLYIKMNDRGKLLTDFENFKAYLHKSIRSDADGRFDLLHAYLGDADCEAERVALLGKINNEYTDFFFRVIDGGNIYDYSCEEVQKKDALPQKFDIAMMNFFNEMIRMEFFRFVNQYVKKETYRNDGKVIADMSGKEFYHFVTSAAEEYRKKYEFDDDKKAEVEQLIKRGFARVRTLLDIFATNQSAILGEAFQDGACSLLALIKESATGKTNASLAASRAMFTFVEKFGLRDQNDSLYLAWSRLVWRCITFIEFEHFNDACSVGDALERIIEELPENAQLVDLWRIVSSFDTSKLNCTLLEQHFKEERIKAKLLFESDSTWGGRIQRAVEWNRFGQIYYLLELAQQSNASYSANDFDTYFAFFEEYFYCPASKTVAFKESVDDETHRCFENALLLTSKEGPYYHLLKKENGSQMLFSYHNYYPILSTNMAAESPHQTMLNVVRTVVNQSGATLGDKVKSLTFPAIDKDDWRNCFLKANLYTLAFSGSNKKDTAICVTEDGYYRLYKDGKQKHTLSAEVHAAMVYCLLLQKGKEPTLNLGTQDRHLQAGDCPTRSVTCKGKKIYYQDGNYYIDGDITAYTLENILDVCEKL